MWFAYTSSRRRNVWNGSKTIHNLSSPYFTDRFGWFFFLLYEYVALLFHLLVSKYILYLYMRSGKRNGIMFDYLRWDVGEIQEAKYSEILEISIVKLVHSQHLPTFAQYFITIWQNVNRLFDCAMDNKQRGEKTNHFNPKSKKKEIGKKNFITNARTSIRALADTSNRAVFAFFVVHE